MKTTLLRSLLGAAALLSCTAFAHAANPFVAGSQWTGIRVSTVGGGSSNIALFVNSPNPSTGKLVILGQSVPVSIACTPTGVVDLQGLGIPYAGFRIHGTVGAQGGTYSLTGNYYITNVPGMHNDTGRVSLLRSYKTVTGGPILIGSTAGTGLLPPGPCFGAFVSASNFTGRLVFEHDVPAADPPSELNPPSEFTGNVSFVTGDGSVKYAVVGTINPEANADGSHTIELLGENLAGNSVFTSLKTTGLLLPAVRTNPTSILGNYELIGLLRTGDVGRFKVSQ
ncbi:hypothetical protein [Armatimonas rosea]|uniref:CHRD domain-containing protein n=1 Tax=Armatimonas rosea TaxID=685828 RepID=A0A7W9W458_ARMRO|nr:hypothetical protein [Armatimonas rosea]MBB6049099.1 hypothetical protein [Armatimonas rosea]